MSALGTEVPPKPVKTPSTAVDDGQPGTARDNPSGGTHSQDEPSRQSTDDSEAELGNNAKKSTSSDAPVGKVHTNLSWPIPAGLAPKQPNDECLMIFRRAIGINIGASLAMKDDTSLEEGRKRASGIYGQVVRQKRHKRAKHRFLETILSTCHVLQIVVAAVLTALGPNASKYEIIITVLGAVNTIVAGILALLKGSGYMEQLAHETSEFQKLQDWIEETESLLCAGVIGSSRKEVGMFVEVAFRKYNACRGCYDPNNVSNIDGLRDGMRKMSKNDGGEITDPVHS